jgi:hypothetical protein
MFVPCDRALGAEGYVYGSSDPSVGPAVRIDDPLDPVVLKKLTALAGCLIRVSPVDSDNWTRMGRSDESGHFELDWGPRRGKVTLMVTCAGYQQAAQVFKPVRPFHKVAMILPRESQ